MINLLITGQNLDRLCTARSVMYTPGASADIQCTANWVGDTLTLTQKNGSMTYQFSNKKKMLFTRAKVKLKIKAVNKNNTTFRITECNILLTDNKCKI